MMRRALTKCMLAAAVGATAGLSGCTQMPTESHGVSDLRAQIAFQAGSDRARLARVLVDGLDVGAVADYLAGTAAVRVLPGAHKLRVIAGSEPLLDEKIYLGDGVSRTFHVK